MPKNMIVCISCILIVHSYIPYGSLVMCYLLDRKRKERTKEARGRIRGVCGRR